MELFCKNWDTLVTIDNNLNPFQKILKDSSEACLPYDTLVSKLRKQNPWIESCAAGRQPSELVIIELMKRSDFLQSKINEINRENKYLRVKCERLAKENQEHTKSLQELVSENSKLLKEFKEVFTSLTIKKPVGQEIAELQTRIMELYAERGKN